MANVAMSDDQKGIEALKPVALKRKSVSHSDKVRYRVYVNSREYIAVIAENALMAMKISGVKVPHRILRDLPMSQNSVSGDRLMPHHLQPTVFLRPDSISTKNKPFEPIAVRAEQEDKIFKPLLFTSLHDHKKVHASTIDASVILATMSGDVEGNQSLVVQRDVDRQYNKKPTASTVEAVQVVENVEDIPESTAVEQAGLTQEEIERLLNEPRA